MRNKVKHQRLRRRPRTTQERRASGEWGRPRRNPNNLIDMWDDKCSCIQKTWKVKRLHQYRELGRGQQHVIFVPEDRGRFYMHTWDLEDWFDNHDISHCIKMVWSSEVIVTTHEQVYKMVGWEPYTYLKTVRPRGVGAKKTETIYEVHTSWRGVYKWVDVKLARPRERRWSKLIGYTLTWWSNKDIGIDRVLARCCNG